MSTAPVDHLGIGDAVIVSFWGLITHRLIASYDTTCHEGWAEWKRSFSGNPFIDGLSLYALLRSIMSCLLSIFEFPLPFGFIPPPQLLSASIQRIAMASHSSSNTSPERWAKIVKAEENGRYPEIMIDDGELKAVSKPEHRAARI